MCTVDMAHCPPGFQKRYVKLFELEADKEVFEWLLSDSKFSIKVGDIGFLDKRRAGKLISFTTNLNPSLCKFLEQIEAVPITAAMQRARRSVSGHRRGVGDAFNVKSGQQLSVATNGEQSTAATKLLTTLLQEKDVGLAMHVAAFTEAGIDMDDLLSLDWKSGTEPQQSLSFDLSLLVSPA